MLFDFASKEYGDRSNSWHSIDIVATNSFFTPTLSLNRIDGDIDIDLCVLNAGKKLSITPDNPLIFPATSLFHGGYSDRSQQSITFTNDREPAQSILYGSLIMLPMGEYTLTPEIETAAPGGTVLGTMLALKRRKVIAEQPVIAGKTNNLVFIQQDQFPIRIEFNYHATASISFKDIVVSLVTEKVD